MANKFRWSLQLLYICTPVNLWPELEIVYVKRMETQKIYMGQTSALRIVYSSPMKKRVEIIAVIYHSRNILYKMLVNVSRTIKNILYVKNILYIFLRL